MAFVRVNEVLPLPRRANVDYQLPVSGAMNVMNFRPFARIPLALRSICCSLSVNGLRGRRQPYDGCPNEPSNLQSARSNNPEIRAEKAQTVLNAAGE